MSVRIRVVLGALLLALFVAWVGLFAPAEPDPSGPAHVEGAMGDPQRDSLPEGQPLSKKSNRSRYRWADDEIQVIGLAASRAPEVLPGAKVLVSGSGEFVARTGRMTREEFAARARTLETRKDVREVRPVFYPTPEAKARRLTQYHLYLTRQVAASFENEEAARAAAAQNGARVVSELEYLPGTFLLESNEPFGALALAEALEARDPQAAVLPQFARRAVPAYVPDDPSFPSQWHLRNTGQGGATPGEDVGAETAWDTTAGAGTVIGIVDDGVQHTHPDLAANYNAGLSIDINDNDSDPSPGPLDDHGTAVAGVAAAVGDNALGVTGAAYEAGFAGIRLIAGPISDSESAQAMVHEDQSIYVYNNSWGPAGTGTGMIDDFPHPLTLSAFANGAANGRGGLGVVYIFAGGNHRSVNDDANYNPLVTSRHVIGVGAIGDTGSLSLYSNPGAALLVCAHSNGGIQGITTTDRTGGQGYGPGDYDSGFGGTSSSAPLTAGAVALIMSANPNVSSRDVQHLLVRTARQVDPGDASWATNGAGYTVSHDYGHGAVDAAAAVALAQNWPYVGSEAIAAQTSSPGIPIPDAGAAVTDTITIPVNQAIRVEHVTVELWAASEYRGDLQIELTSPSGTQSVLAESRFEDSDDQGYQGWQFKTTHCWGEDSRGDWVLSLQDNFPVDDAQFNQWTIRIWGTTIDTTPPGAGVVNDGTGLDVDYQSSTTTIDANWANFPEPESGVIYEWAIGITPGGEEVQAFTSVAYATSATATGLVLAPATTYYVSVRATNFEGLQAVSTSDGVEVDSIPPTAPGTPSGTPNPNNTGSFTVTWAGSTDAGGSGVALYFVERSDNAGPFVSLGAGIATTSFPEGVLPEGAYTYRVYAQDGAGNVSGYSGTSTPVVVDTTEPETSITSAPPDPAGSLDADFTFDSTDPGSTFETRLDGGAWVANGATTTRSYVGLSVGVHTFEVRATDPAGNQDLTPAVHVWTSVPPPLDGLAPVLNPMADTAAIGNWTLTSTDPTVFWNVDGTAAGMPGGPYFTAPASLNYNNGIDYDTGGANSGAATSPGVDLSGMTTVFLKFMCNYSTDTSGTATDQRIVQVSNDGFGSTLVDETLSTTPGSVVAGACAAMGTWHEHVVTLNPAWGTVQVRFIFDTVDGVANGNFGWFVDDVEISDLLVTALNQYEPGMPIPVAVGTLVPGTTTEFRGIISGAAGGTVILEVEVVPVGSPFTGVATASTTSAGTGNPISVLVAIPGGGDYQWRVRTIDVLSGTPSEWMAFGLNGPAEGDFSVVVAVGGGGGGGGCGSPGVDLLWLPAIAWLLRRRRSR